jgi:hypothetical protein
MTVENHPKVKRAFAGVVSLIVCIPFAIVGLLIVMSLRALW